VQGQAVNKVAGSLLRGLLAGLFKGAVGPASGR
jgi:hypothetical protein